MHTMKSFKLSILFGLAVYTVQEHNHLTLANNITSLCRNQTNSTNKTMKQHRKH